MANPLVCIFNPITTLIDEVQSVSTGPAASGVPVVTNLSGLLDTSLLGFGVLAVAGEPLSSGQLVNIYSASGSVHVQVASAQNTGTAPSGDPYPRQAQGFVNANAGTGGTVTVNFFGTFKYVDPNSEFIDATCIGREVFLSAVTPGGITLTAPVSLEESVGYVVSWVAPNVVTVSFIAGFLDFSHISGVNPIIKGGTGASTAPAALVNLGAGSYTQNQFYASPTGAPGALTVRAFSLADIPQSGATTGQAIVWNGTAWVPSTDLVGFNQIGTGTNTTATMTVGSGASIVVTGTGVVEATELATTAAPVVLTAAAPPSVGQALVATSATTATWSFAAGVPASPVNSVQFNNAGAFGGSANFTWINAQQTLDIGGGTGTPVDISVNHNPTFLNAGWGVTNTTPYTGAGEIQGIDHETTYTGTTTSVTSLGMRNVVRMQTSNTTTDTLTHIRALQAIAVTGTGTGSVSADVAGFYGQGFIEGTGTYQNFYGVAAEVGGGGANAATVNGLMTAFYAIAPNGAGSFTGISPNYGLYIEDQTIAGMNSGTYPQTYAIKVKSFATTGMPAPILTGDGIPLFAMDYSIGSIVNAIAPTNTGTFANYSASLTLAQTAPDVNDWFGVDSHVEASGTQNYGGLVVGCNVDVRNSTSGGVTYLAGSKYNISPSGSATTDAVGIDLEVVNVGTSTLTTLGVGVRSVVSARGSGVSYTDARCFSAQIEIGASSATRANGIYVLSPTSIFSTGIATHLYGLYIEDQTVQGGTRNPDPWAIWVAGGKSQFNGIVSMQGGLSTNLVTLTGAYTATSKDVTLNCNGTFTLSLAPFSFTLTSVANASGGSPATTTYTGTITGGASNAYAGAIFTIAGFTNANNNGTFTCIGSTATTLVLQNQNGVAEIHAATAAVVVVNGQEYRIKNIGSGTITVSSAVNIDFATFTTLTVPGQSIIVQWDGTQWWIY